MAAASSFDPATTVPWSIVDHGIDRADDGGRVAYEFYRGRTIPTTVIHSRSQAEERCFADYPRPLLDLSEIDCDEHRWWMANQHTGCSAPSLPLNIPRRQDRRPFVVRLVDAVLHRAWRGHP